MGEKNIAIDPRNLRVYMKRPVSIKEGLPLRFKISNNVYKVDGLEMIPTETYQGRKTFGEMRQSNPNFTGLYTESVKNIK